MFGLAASQAHVLNYRCIKETTICPSGSADSRDGDCP